MSIEIVTTPNGNLKETGFGGRHACDSVLNALRRKGYKVTIVVCETELDLDKIIARKPSLVVLAVKYIPLASGDKIWLSDYFMCRNINFTGSLMHVLELDSNKVLAKNILSNKGVAIAKYFTTTPEQYSSESELPIKFPLFLKPIDAANGNGIDDSSFVTCFLDFKSKVKSLYNTFNMPVLVEEYLSGREFTVAVIRKSNGELMVAPIEIVPPESKNGLRILGSKVKREDSEILKKIEDPAMLHKIKKMAIDCFIHLGIRDYGRIDIKLNDNDDCFFMEANLIPGMTPGSSYFPQSYEIENGFSHDEVVHLMLDNALCRANLFDLSTRNLTG